jgi:hypothetical protein
MSDGTKFILCITALFVLVVWAFWSDHEKDKREHKELLKRRDEFLAKEELKPRCFVQITAKSEGVVQVGDLSGSAKGQIFKTEVFEPSAKIDILLTRYLQTETSRQIALGFIEMCIRQKAYREIRSEKNEDGSTEVEIVLPISSIKEFKILEAT